MDRIIISKITAYGYHGVLPAERSLGQEFQATVTITTGPVEPPHQDNPERVLDYRTALEAVRSVLTGPPCRLLETVAERIAARILALPGVLVATVRVGKPNPPLPEVQGGVWVEISRGRP